MELPIGMAIDTTDNWNRSDAALLDGELAIEVCGDPGHSHPDGEEARHLLVGDGEPVGGNVARLRAKPEFIAALPGELARAVSEATEAEARERGEADRGLAEAVEAEARERGEADRGLAEAAAEAAALAEERLREAKNYADEKIAAAKIAIQRFLPPADDVSGLPDPDDDSISWLCRVRGEQAVYQCVAGQAEWALYSDDSDFVNEFELAEALAAEARERADADQGLAEAIALLTQGANGQIITNITARINEEIQAREDADIDLQEALDAEATARQEGDSVLGAVLDGVQAIPVDGAFLTRAINGLTPVAVHLFPQDAAFAAEKTIINDAEGTVGVYVEHIDVSTISVRTMSVAPVGTNEPTLLGVVQTNADLPQTIAEAEAQGWQTPRVDDYAQVREDETQEGSRVEWYIHAIDEQGNISWGNHVPINDADYQEQAAAGMAGRLLTGGPSAGTFGDPVGIEELTETALEDQAGDQTVFTAMQSTVFNFLQLIRNNLKWIFANKANLSGATFTGPVSVPAKTTAGTSSTAVATEAQVSRKKRFATFVIGEARTQSAGDVDYLVPFSCGQQNDAAVYIKAAIAALPAGGGKILLLDGTYPLYSTITINKKGVTIEGMGQGTVLEYEGPAGSANDGCAISIGAFDCQVSNLKIKGWCRAGIDVTADGAVISNTVISNASDLSEGCGIFIFGAINSSPFPATMRKSSIIKGNTINGRTSAGILIFLGAASIITDNIINNMATGSVNSYGITLKSSEHNIVKGNVLKNLKSTGQSASNTFAFYVNASSHYNIIQGNSCRCVIRGDPDGGANIGSLLTADGAAAASAVGSATTIAALRTGGAMGHNIV